MSSGVTASDECLQKYSDLQLGHKYKYVIFGLSPDLKSIEVLDAVEPDTRSNEDAYAEFLDKLPDDECRYAVYDFEFEKEDGSGKRSKIVFFSWTPDTARIRPKMVYASSREALRKSLTGISVDIQGTEKDEVSYQNTFDRCNRSR